MNDGHTTQDTHSGIYEGKFGGKCNHHIRYNGTKLIKNQLALIAIPDSGTCSDEASWNKYTLEYSLKCYYVDN